MYSKRLSRQLKKSFGAETPEAICVDDPAQIKEALASFIEMIQDTYSQLDDKLELTQRNLEVSSAELTAVNSNLFLLNQSFDAMINSLGQGFLLFGDDLKCLPVASKICEELLECQPAGRQIHEVLRIPQDELGDFSAWCKMMFNERIAFDDMAALGPSQFTHSDQNRVIQLEYKPCRDRGGKISAIVLVATDRTAEFAARRQAAELEAHVKLITNILKNKNRFRQFVGEMRRMISELNSLANSVRLDAGSLVESKRLLHTMKGVSGAFGLMRVKSVCHETETRLEQNQTDCHATLRSSVTAIRSEFESLLESNRELIGDIGQGESKREIETTVLRDFFQRILSASSKEEIAQAFRAQILSVPLRKLFADYDTYLAELALHLGKRVAPLQFTGDNPMVLEDEIKPLLSVLPHVFANIVDHGLESEEARMAQGKSPLGLVQVSFEQSPRGLRILISDDGKGIDVRALREKLEQVGETKLALEGSDAEVIAQIFRPGLSTANAVSGLSGRGVGMDALRSEIRKLGGDIQVHSVRGKGTSFSIMLPSFGLQQIDMRTAS